jgi:hypothetical protein
MTRRSEEPIGLFVRKATRRDRRIINDLSPQIRYIVRPPVPRLPRWMAT